MKSIRARVVLLAFVLGSLGIPALGEGILVLNEQCNKSAAFFPAALDALGLAYTEVNDEYDFFLALTGGGSWDLVIVDEYSSRLYDDTLDAIAAYIVAGGRVYMNYWEWDKAIAAAFEAEVGDHYFDPIPIYVWEAAHPLLTTPNAVGALNPTTNTCDSDGAYFRAMGNGVEIAGYSPESATLQAAIVVGNDGRTVLFGGILGLFSGDENGDGRADGLEFAENVVAFLLGTPIVRPRPSLWSAVSTADLDRLLSEMEITFERTATPDGRPVWSFELGGVLATLFAYDLSGEGYTSLQFYTTWELPAQGAVPAVNSWNLTHRGSRAYVNRDGEIALDADLYLAGGVNWRAVRAFIARFEQTITEFRRHLGR
ncbi:MAG: hypothetical protein BIP78_0996 [Candidatus Bipolaricaulis sibiricus]|uniref:Uncharacterized protein n=1 Tax=Bipolaricaulis sibiricus TaxID=2501609 RepID=A0A410FUV9_BIPS1|nr:MAG: hypothetical protein BIP78_0996 [Candidatus Bipolaricaulis sibiricus]